MQAEKITRLTLELSKLLYCRETTLQSDDTRLTFNPGLALIRAVTCSKAMLKSDKWYANLVY